MRALSPRFPLSPKRGSGDYPMRRIDQLLSNLGYCSRREARSWVDAELVTIGGKLAADADDRVDPATVLVEGEPLDHPHGLLLLLHKPLGRVCSRDDREGPSLYELFPDRWRRRNPPITSVGRLDKDTTGLLLITDQSDLVHRLTSPKNKVPKTYVATLDREATPEEGVALRALFASGTFLLTGEKDPCAPAQLAWRDPHTAELILTEGRYHQVRRMFGEKGFLVTALHRERFGDLDLTGVAPGTWRELPLDTFMRKEQGAPVGVC